MKDIEKAIELVAAECHKQWRGWMRDVLYKITRDEDAINLLNGSGIKVEIGPDLFFKWMHQINTPYDKLAEHEKESDRIEARKIIKIIEKEKGSEKAKRDAILKADGFEAISEKEQLRNLRRASRITSEEDN